MLSGYLLHPDEQEARPDAMRPYCSYALAKLAGLRRSGALDPPSPMARQLGRLCEAVAGGSPAEDSMDGLPPGWARLLAIADRSDGRRLHLDIGAALPVTRDTVVRVDSLASEPRRWQVMVRAWPQWWLRSADGRSKWSVLSVSAEDDQGGRYLGSFGGSTTEDSCEELALRFAPRLDPLARRLTLVFGAGASDITVGFWLDGADFGRAPAR